MGAGLGGVAAVAAQEAPPGGESERIRLLESQGGILTEDVRGLIPAAQRGDVLTTGYLFLRYMNVVQGQYIGVGEIRYDLYEAIPHLFARRSKLYSNGGSEIYY
ncbi:MAG: hypothetical protein Q8O54_08495 [Brevundimonas sp.]|nr:hypothetical protein [Brevundimonas sp.]